MRRLLTLFRLKKLIIAVLVSLLLPATAFADTVDQLQTPFYDPTAVCTTPVLAGNDNIQIAFNFLTSQGLPAAAAAGIIGNLEQESGQGIDPSDEEKPGQSWINTTDALHYGVGIAQWDGSRRLKIISTAESSGGLTLSGLEANTSENLSFQLNYLWTDLTSNYPGAYSQMKSATDPAQAAAQFNKGFEGGTDPNNNRETNAQTVYQQYGGGASSGGQQLDISSIVAEYKLQSAIVEQVGGGVAVSANADQPPVTPASTMKLIIADVAIRSGLNLNQTIGVSGEEVYPGDPAYPNPTSIPLTDAINKMLTVSSNTAANALIKAMGGPSDFTKKAQQYGYSHTVLKGYYYPSNDPINSSTIHDEADAMNHIFSSTSGYTNVQSYLKQAAQTDNKFGINDEANKWAGTSQVAGNVGLFSANGQQYIIGVYINGNYAVSTVASAVSGSSEDIYSQLNSSNGSVGGGNGSSTCQESIDCNASANSGLSQVRQNVVCAARQEYSLWQSGQLKPGTDYFKYSANFNEPWCADFVSWIYQQAGQPFTGGRDGWDIYAVEGIYNLGQANGNFHWHPQSSGYTPQPGDIAIHYNTAYSNPYYHTNIFISASGGTSLYIGGDQGSGTPSNNSVSPESLSGYYNDNIIGYVSPD